MGFYDNKETAAFNLAMPYLYRVNTVLNSNYTAFKNHDAPIFLHNLKQLRRELIPFLKDPKEKDEIKKQFEELAKIPNYKKEIIWNKMEDIEILLRQHFKDLGMLMPKISDPRFLFQKQS